MQDNTPQFNRKKNGSLYDRGHADAYYCRGAIPHWYPAGSYKGTRVAVLSREEEEEYWKGYNECEEKKEWF